MEDDGEVFMFPGRLAAKGDTSTGRPVPSMINCHARHQEGAGVHWEVCHGFLIIVEGGGGSV